MTARGPKILDFGLAKSAAGSDSDDATRAVDAMVTAAGTAMGTPAYMSPEQLRGEPLDRRTDLFSFGLVLYEMASGRPAFDGKTTAMISAAILNQQPRNPREVRSSVPTRLAEIMLKLLEKDPADRYQTAADLRADRRRVKRSVPGAVPPQRRLDVRVPVGHRD